MGLACGFPGDGTLVWAEVVAKLPSNKQLAKSKVVILRMGRI
jgi:hypothetical protein